MARVMNDFVGKVAVVTGAASGIGYQLCCQLSGSGAKVYAADRDAKGLEELPDAGRGAITRVVLDVTDEKGVKSLLDRVVSECGQLDYLFNNAGIVVGGDFEHMDTDRWQSIININLWGVIYGSQYGYRIMQKQRRGHIVNTASTAGLMPVAKSAAYAATKHAVVGLTTTLREEGRAHHVKASVVVPGVVDTGIFASATNLKHHNYSASIDKVPFSKISPADAAKAILKGVVKNKQYIVFPFYNRVILALHRLMPGLMSKLVNFQR